MPAEEHSSTPRSRSVPTGSWRTGRSTASGGEDIHGLAAQTGRRATRPRLATRLLLRPPPHGRAMAPAARSAWRLRSLLGNPEQSITNAVAARLATVHAFDCYHFPSVSRTASPLQMQTHRGLTDPDVADESACTCSALAGRRCVPRRPRRAAQPLRPPLPRLLSETGLFEAGSRPSFVPKSSPLRRSTPCGRTARASSAGSACRAAARSMRRSPTPGSSRSARACGRSSATAAASRRA